MTKKEITIGCELCRGSKEPGWLCEDHPEQPFEHGPSGGAGRPCV
jgi:hypothetical protein